MKVCLISLGCDKNLVDSEKMLGLLRDAGHEITDDENEAEAIIINSCCFIHDAKEESIENIIAAAERKKSGVLKRLVVTGCLAERYADEIRKEIPEVDAVLGTTAWESVTAALKTKKGITKKRELSYLPDPKVRRFQAPGNHVSYLKISEGCNKHCTYCVIPSVRGPYRSFSMEELVAEASELAEAGAKELILVAQETTVYGVDLYGEKKLPELLQRLCKIDGIERIRLMYCYPEEITDELIAVMKEEPKICKYLDMPIQHASDEILKRMGRKTTEKELRTVLKKLRKEIPGIALRTTLITGFPGETEEDMEKLKRFVVSGKFDRLGVFPYSKEEGTPAAVMKNQVPKRIRVRRKNEIMRLQRDICAEKAKKCIGKRFDVMVDGFLPGEEVYVGRTYRDAPGIDGMVYFTANRTLMSGETVSVRITGAGEYDLIGEIKE